jgi:FkbM family methyltransferase
MASLKRRFDLRNANAAEGEIVLRDNLSLAIHPDSLLAFEYFCFRSPEMVAELDAFISRIRPCHRLLDVGALHGIFSLVFVAGRHEASAVAVDASPRAFSKLLYNVHKNKFRTVTTVECALSDKMGSLPMHYEWEHAVAAPMSGQSQKTLEVQMRTGDELCESIGFEPDTIKIDVEGHEIKVLRGLKRMISRHRPLVFLEVHSSRIATEGDDVTEIVEFLARLGYAAIDICGRSIALERIFEEEDRFILSATSTV